MEWTCASEGRCVGTAPVLVKWFTGFENEFFGFLKMLQNDYWCERRTHYQISLKLLAILKCFCNTNIIATYIKSPYVTIEYILYLPICSLDGYVNLH